METKPSESVPADSTGNPRPANPIKAQDKRDLLLHLEAYLARRDGVDKLLKISRYASKIILSSSALPGAHPLAGRLKSFESSVGISRKAFRLGKFIQDVNALRATLHDDFFLSAVAYGGEGLYFFVEQFVWLAKAGLIHKKHLSNLQKTSAWCELVGYIGSVGLKMKELKRISEDEACLVSSIDVEVVRGVGCWEEEEKLRKLRQKKLMKRLSIVQDLADGLMALADIADLSAPLLLSSAGLLSALISTHKNWVSC